MSPNKRQLKKQMSSFIHSEYVVGSHSDHWPQARRNLTVLLFWLFSLTRFYTGQQRFLPMRGRNLV